MNAQLIVSYHNDIRRVALCGATLFIGSETGNDIVISDPNVPAIAAKIIASPQGYCITPVKSGYRITHNNSKAKQAVLVDGDILSFGTTTITFEYIRSATPTKALTGTSLVLMDKMALFAELVGSERDLKKLLTKLMAMLFETIGGTEAFIFTLDSRNEPQVFISSRNDKASDRFSDTIVQDVLATGVAIYVPNALAHPKFAAAQSVADLKLSSVLCCPITIAQKKIGIIYLGATGAATSFTDNDLNALKLMALMAGMLIDHVAFISQQATTIERLSPADGIVAQSAIMQQVLRDSETVAATDMTVLLQGETGTGKDIIAQHIHSRSPRAGKPFIVVNCSTLKGDLLESELFGHKKGSFTGATTDNAGLCCAADNGTLFLDEIGEMDVGLQARLLRTLETGSVRAVGATTERKINVRIICATNKDLQSMIDAQTFRADLFYRLHQFVITLPPLRQRGEDIIHLAYFFLEKYKHHYPHKDIRDFAPQALRFMAVHTWPGNIRELANIIHRSVVSATSPIIEITPNDKALPTELGFDLAKATNAFQRDLIIQALRHCQDNREKTAEMLGVGRSTLYRMMEGFGVGRE